MRKFNLCRKGVLPTRPERKKQRAEELRSRLASGAEPPETASRSYEMVADALVGLCAGIPRRIMATLPNRGQIENLPRDAAVETWAVASRTGIAPVVSGAVPPPVLDFMTRIVTEQELTVEAALTGSRETLVRALEASPMLERKECSAELADALLEANRAYLPQFFPERGVSILNRHFSREVRG